MNPDGLQERWQRGVKLKDILTFIHTTSGQRMKQAAEDDKLWKEQPFVLGISVRDIYPEMTEADETMLVPRESSTCVLRRLRTRYSIIKTDKIWSEQKLLKIPVPA